MTAALMALAATGLLGAQLVRAQSVTPGKVVNLAMGMVAAADRPHAAEPRVEMDGARGPLIEPVQRPFASQPAGDLDAWAPGAMVVLPWVDSAPLYAQDEVDAGPGVPLRAGISRSLDLAITPTNGGAWVDTPSGPVWRVALTSPGAVAIGVEFSQFELPAGAVVVVSGADGALIETYTRRGPNGQAAFASAPVQGDTVLVEYQPSLGDESLPQIEIAGVAHMYRGSAFGGPQAELPCQVDVMCRTVSEAARDSVGRMLYPSGGGWYLCTGALLIDVDTNTFAAWFQTANHCINTQESASGLIVYWLFQTSTCGAAEPNPDSKPKSFGGQLLYNNPSFDYALLRLYEDVQDGQTMAGWTTTPPSGNVVGISHPGGSAKKFSSGPVTTAQPICGGLPLSNYIYNDWLDGITEGGSSGSPLFDSNWRAVGPLFGTCYYAPPDCTNPQDYNNVYGRFSGTYPSISSYLTSITPDDTYEDNDDFETAALIGSGVFDLRLVDFFDYFVVQRCTAGVLSVKVYYTEADMNLYLAVYNESGTLIGVSNGAVGYEQVIQNVPAGRYFIRTSRTTGWGGDYTLVVAGPAAGGDCNGNGVPDSCESGLCRGDVDGDGQVGQGDLARLLAAYGSAQGQSGFDPAADVDCDGLVGQSDLAIVLSEYGQTCP